jgi:hypothetical protein
MLLHGPSRAIGQLNQSTSQMSTTTNHDLDAWSSALQHVSKDAWPGTQSFPIFMERVAGFSAPRVLELGTYRALPDVSTRKDHLFPHASEYVGTDIQAGIDVDLVADVHRLTEFTGEEAFDIVLTEAGFEHFKYPHLAAHEIMKALRIGGLVWVQTHQTFPIHAVPYDYFRFSTDALRSLFGEGMGMKVLASAYASPAAIYSHVDRHGHKAPAFLHVNILAEKVAPTPKTYVYEFDGLV